MGMLVLTTREGESIRITTPDGTVIEVKYLGNTGRSNQAKIGVDAPKEWPIVRIDRAGFVATGELKP